jgi:multidrug transporter EmrE-like cation transporter
VNFASFATAIVSISLNALAQICLRKTMLIVGPPAAGSAHWLRYGLAIARNPWMFGGLASYAVSILVWMAVLAKVEVSAAYPLLSIGYILAAAAGFFFLGEDVTLTRMVGIAFICSGVFFIARS